MSDPHDQSPFDDVGVADWVSELLGDHFDDGPLDEPGPATAVDLDPSLFDEDAAAEPAGDAPAEPVPPGSIDPLEEPIELDATDDLDDPSGPLAVELDPTGEPWPAADAGLAGLAAVEHALDALGVAGLDAFVEVVERLGLSDELDLGLDGRTTAVVLGELGIDALVEHGSLDDLSSRLDEGDEVILTGPDGQVLAVVDATDAVLVLEPQGGGSRIEARLDLVETAWAASGYEMVLAEALPGDGSAIRLSGAIALLQVSVPAEALQ